MTSKTDLAARRKALSVATAKLKKRYGEDIILDTTKPTSYEIVSTGSLLINQATGIGGLPMGRLVEVYGPEACGKSSFCYSVCAEAQQQYPEKLVLYVDIEQAAHLSYMEQFGVDLDPDKFIFVQPNSIEEALTIIHSYTETGLISVVVLDSVGASMTEDQIEKGYDENTMGSLAKKMSVGLNKLKNLANETSTLMIFVNQVYAKMSYMGGEETKGGRALKYTASLRIKFTKRDLLTGEGDKEKVIGQGLSYKFVKNKVGQPYTSGETILYFGKGFDKYSEVVEIAVGYGIIKRGGAWYNFTSSTGEEIKLQGKDKVIDLCRNMEPEFIHLQKQVLDVLTSNQQLLSEDEIEEIKKEEAEEE